MVTVTAMVMDTARNHLNQPEPVVFAA